jgi:G:T/U-mismatch repair DNA glycosylase
MATTCASDLRRIDFINAVYILPNPSGLNRAFTLLSLIAAYQELAEALAE